MTELTLTRQQARRFLLAHQNLWPPHKLAGKAGILEHMERVGCIQYDPLNIVGRNPELVLQARLADMQPLLLQELLYEDRQLLDAWDKNMSIYQLADWPFFRRNRERARQRYGDSARPANAILPQVRQALKERGPLSSIDLDFDQTVDWSWAPTRLARAALESMYAWGELIVHHKVNTRKVYDLARHHLPAELLAAPEPNPTTVEFHDWYVSRRIGGIGLLWKKSGDAWLGMHGIKNKERSAALTRLLEQGRVIEAQVESIALPLYLRSEDQATLERVLAPDVPAPQATILAPLDNLLWDRRLVQALFDFAYIWEVYKPVTERRYGYYVLPILYGDRFIARFEPGRDKKSGALIIKNWWWEPGVEQTEHMQHDLGQCFARFLGFLGANTIEMPDEVARQAGLDWLARGTA